MRLINSETMEMVEFYDADIPEYAILSHTWGDEEVTYRDFVTSLAPSKKGYQKIVYCQRQARKEFIPYFWIDSCCIDKTSSAELSEAINSMYRWYKSAQVCYAYMSDVAGSEKDQIELENSQFSQSRWFTRGWTLQELLAPKNLYFYSQEWELLGHKLDLSAVLSRITGIEEDALYSERAMRKASVARKMSWAANRKTTRSEDIAYCLLGIFNVNMPLLYGEGEKAFIRLQEEIIRTTDDHSLFAWGAEGSSGLGTMRFYPGKGLLASSPGLFRDSSEVVPDEGARPHEPAVITNKGIRLTLPKYSGPSSSVSDAQELSPRSTWLVLACRPVDSLLHVYALPVRPQTESQWFRGYGKPILVSRDEISEPTSVTLYVKKDSSDDTGTVRSIFNLPRGLWIRTLQAGQHALRILSVVPSKNWDAQNRVFRLDSSAFYAQIRVSISNTGGVPLVILLGREGDTRFCGIYTDSELERATLNGTLPFHTAGRPFQNMNHGIKVEYDGMKVLGLDTGIDVSVFDIKIVSLNALRSKDRTK